MNPPPLKVDTSFFKREIKDTRPNLRSLIIAKYNANKSEADRVTRLRDIPSIAGRMAEILLLHWISIDDDGIILTDDQIIEVFAETADISEETILKLVRQRNHIIEKWLLRHLEHEQALIDAGRIDLLDSLYTLYNTLYLNFNIDGERANIAGKDRVQRCKYVANLGGSYKLMKIYIDKISCALEQIDSCPTDNTPSLESFRSILEYKSKYDSPYHLLLDKLFKRLGDDNQQVETTVRAAAYKLNGINELKIAPNVAKGLKFDITLILKYLYEYTDNFLPKNKSKLQNYDILHKNLIELRTIIQNINTMYIRVSQSTVSEAAKETEYEKLFLMFCKEYLGRIIDIKQNFAKSNIFHFDLGVRPPVNAIKSLYRKIFGGDDTLNIWAVMVVLFVLMLVSLVTNDTAPNVDNFTDSVFKNELPMLNYKIGTK